jgi:lysozyme
VRRALVLSLLLTSACADGRGDGERLGTAQQANVCATGTTLEGVDVSTYDGAVDWPEVKQGGRDFAIAKATEGTSVTDSEFSTNWPGMKSAGIVRSAYHFFHCDVTPSAQASFFLGVMGTLEPGDLPPSLDFEDTTTCTPSQGVAMAVEWLDAVASATGTLPILYTSVNVFSSFDDTEQFAGHAQLWVASRGVTCPDLPSPFTAWSLWQYSLTGTAAGLPNSNGMADLDQFNGDMTALLAITLGGSATTGSSSASSGGPPSCTVSGVAGTCIDTSVCATMPGYVSTPGQCPGPATEQCCTPTSGSSVSTTSSSSSTGGAGGAGSVASSSSASSSSGRDAATSGAAGAGGGVTASNATSSGCSVAMDGACDMRWSLLALAALACRARRRHVDERRRPQARSRSDRATTAADAAMVSAKSSSVH